MQRLSATFILMNRFKLKGLLMFYFKHKNILNILQHLQVSIARIFVPIFMYLGISPNSVTLLRFVIGVSFATYYFLSGGYANNLCGLLVAFLATIFDFVDGELARKTNSTSNVGKFLDESSDQIFMYMIFLSIFLSTGNGGLFSTSIREIGIVFLVIHAFTLCLFEVINSMLNARLSSNALSYEDLWAVLFDKYGQLNFQDRVSLSMLDVHKYSVTKIFFTVSYLLIFGILIDQIPLIFLILCVTFLFRSICLYIGIILVKSKKYTNIKLINFAREREL